MSHRVIHEKWAQNRQATAVCDFCNRRNIPLQKCQDCNINICQQCTSQGKLEDDAHHMLSRDAADSFEWHRWGKDKNTKRVASVDKAEPIMRVETPDPEPSVARADPFQSLGGYGAFAPPDRSFQYSPASYSHPIPMMYSQHHITVLQKPTSVGFPPTGQYPANLQIPRYPSTPPPYSMYGGPAGQSIYNYIFQQPQYSSYPSQVPQQHFELRGLGKAVVPRTSEQLPQSSQKIPAHFEDVQRHVQSSSEQTAIQAPPPTTILAYRSMYTDPNAVPQIPELPQAQPEGIQRPEPASNKQSATQTSTVTSGYHSANPEKTHKSSLAPSPSKQAIRRPRRPHEDYEDYEDSGQDSSRDVSSPVRRPAKKARRTNASQVPGEGQRLRSTARVSKRPRQNYEDDDSDVPRKPSAKKLDCDNNLQAKIVNLHVKSAHGVKRLREILGTPPGRSRSSPTRQLDSLSRVLSQSVSSASQPNLSIQARKKICIDELLEAASIQPRSDDQSTPLRGWKGSPQLSVNAEEKDNQVNPKVHPTQWLHIGEEESTEVKDAALILLSMRHTR